MPAYATRAYQELYVVSDLHLGGFSEGDRNYRLFRETPALEWLIGHVLERSLVRGANGVALVLGGDIIDFLALQSPRVLDVERAIEKLEEAFRDDEQEPVWKALQAYVRTGAGDLVIMVGNHDVELGLPWVQYHLLEYLAGDDHAARGRVVFAVDGAGFRCAVGHRSVLCVHGNEVDLANQVEHERLRQIAGAVQRDTKPPKWIPSAGTKLVVDVINELKREYQWIDLLKPQGQGAAYVLAAIDPKAMARPNDGLRIMATAVHGELRRRAGYLSEDDPEAAGPPGTETSMEPSFPEVYRAPAPPLDFAQEELQWARDAAVQGTDPVYLTEDEGQMLAWGNLIRGLDLAGGLWKILRDAKNLRESLLLAVREDRRYDVREPDETSESLAKDVGDEIDILIAGHTHHHKSLPRGEHRAYFNSGTWISLMRLTERALQEDVFDRVLSALREGSYESVRRPILTPDGDEVHLVETRRTVVRITLTEGHRVTGELTEVINDGAKWRLRPIEDSKRVI